LLKEFKLKNCAKIRLDEAYEKCDAQHKDNDLKLRRCKLNQKVNFAWCINNQKCEILLRAHMDTCIIRVQLLRKSGKYSQKRIDKAAGCFQIPLKRHWRCTLKNGETLKN